MAFKETEIMSAFETVIGLEVHLQLNTKSKIFCSCANRYGCAPNTNVCPVCLGLPGSLPVLNSQALLYAIKVGLALNAEINSFIKLSGNSFALNFLILLLIFIASSTFILLQILCFGGVVLVEGF